MLRKRRKKIDYVTGENETSYQKKKEAKKNKLCEIGWGFMDLSVGRFKQP